MQKLFAKLSLLFTIAASVCMIIGIATPEWLSTNGRYQGLWEYCFYQTHAAGARQCIQLDRRPDFEGWFNGVRALVILAYVCTWINIVLLFLYVMRNDGRQNLNRIKFALVASVMSLLLCMAGIALYVVKKNEGHFPKEYTLAWSFILTAVGGGVMGLVVIPLLLEVRNSRVLGLYESI